MVNAFVFYYKFWWYWPYILSERCLPRQVEFLWMNNFGWIANLFREGLYRLACIWRPVRAWLKCKLISRGAAPPRCYTSPIQGLVEYAIFSSVSSVKFYRPTLAAILTTFSLSESCLPRQEKFTWFWVKCKLFSRGALPPRCYTAPFQGCNVLYSPRF